MTKKNTRNVEKQNLLCVRERTCCSYENPGCWGQRDPFTGRITCTNFGCTGTIA